MIKKYLDKIQAWRRGETRTVPQNVRGRVYTKKGTKPSGPVVKAMGTATCDIKITRADGSIERSSHPATIERK